MAGETLSRDQQLRKGLDDFVRGHRDTPEAQLWIADDIERQQSHRRFDRPAETTPHMQTIAAETGQLALFGAASETP